MDRQHGRTSTPRGRSSAGHMLTLAVGVDGGATGPHVVRMRRSIRIANPLVPAAERSRGPAFAITEFATDSPLEGDGFELPVPRAMQARFNAKIAGSSCAVRNSRGRNCSFGGRRGVGIGSPITRNRGLSTVLKIVVWADVVIGLSSLIFLVSQFNTVHILRGNRTV